MDYVRSRLGKKKEKPQEYELLAAQVGSAAKTVSRIYGLLSPSGPASTDHLTSQQLASGSTAACKLLGSKMIDSILWFGGKDATGHPTSQKSVTSMLPEPLPRFGPIYGNDVQFVSFAKKKAWEHVRYKSPGEDLNVKEEKISAAVRKYEKQARETYAIDVAVERFQFRETMIQDGCFFLQLAFMILGKSHIELGYAKNDLVFGAGRTNKKDVDKWLEAMFFVGNQIPLVILKALIKQDYFQNLINRGDLKPVSDLRKRALYELLVFPELPKTPRNNIRWLPFQVGVRSWLPFQVEVRRTGDSIIEPQPSDVLHGLQRLVLGPHPANQKFEEFGGHFDLEAASYNDYDDTVIGERDKVLPGNAIATQYGVGSTGRIFPSAQELKQSGIRIKKLKNSAAGPRSIHFKSYYFWANLYLPILTVQEDTEVVLTTLKKYEMSNQQLGKHNREVISYINLLSDLIQTPHDMRILRKKGIVKGHSVYAEKLPGIIRRLDSKDATLTYNLRNVRRKITNYSSPLVIYQNILNFVVFLTVLQTVFTLVAYFKPPPN